MVVPAVIRRNRKQSLQHPERERADETPPGAPIRVLSVDDHPLLREGIAAIINSQPDMLLVADAVQRQRGFAEVS